MEELDALRLLEGAQVVSAVEVEIDRAGDNAGIAIDRQDGFTRAYARGHEEIQRVAAEGGLNGERRCIGTQSHAYKTLVFKNIVYPKGRCFA
ncbi:hypothetical protein AGMMS50256_22870 [Betaproteobacteria bacterium]|nr:hypothetical protein AGMMS50256_22870 [Betaproteobacteria bacterium]